MLEALKKEVCAANLQLVAEGLVVQTWGNVSGIDRAAGVGEWAWPGCFVQPLPHMEYDRAAMLPKRTDPGCAGQ